ncbi:MAG: fimbrillin family protein, partial [Alistipes sp.]
MKSIKTIRSLVLLLMLAAGAAACSKHDDITPAVWNGEIRLSSEISSQVKTPTSDVPNDQQIAAGQIVRFFVDNAGTNGSSATPLYENYLVTANGSGGFTKCNAQEADMCYPATGNVDIYAFQINTVGSSTVLPTNTTPLTHSVSPDQCLNYGENYLKSDLLYAANKGVQRSDNAVQMKFYHLLSKVEVALKTGEPCLTNAVVTIENTRLKANFQPDKSADINDATSGQAARAKMITLPTDDADSNPPASITLATALSTDFTTYASAVVVPQKMTKGSHFIKVQPNGVAPLYYTLPEDLNLESGKKYQFKITVNLTKLTVETSTITNWESGKSSDVIAIIPIGSKDIAFARIGDFYFSDGTIESGDNTLT